MKNYLLGRFKGRKMTHLFEGFAYGNPVCKQEAWRKFPKVAIVFPATNPKLTCPVCKKILYGESK